ncbi:MAG: energy transducer TonB [Methylomonas sp.]|jgi:protein TonB|uniref:energy transducer TonB n=1 Tax=Methylomonas sp. TaxID=418 RepID=UPI0025D800F6|nr:energy transducer TonB [Methylomonas sp.]MCK9609232.1 energy transducer TonB [Methylomonas sp.]
MDFFQARGCDFFPLHKVGNSFVDTSTAATGRQQSAPTTRADRKEGSINPTVLFFIVLTVSGLHLFGLKYFFYPDRPEQSPPKPILMDVAMLTVPAVKPEVAPTPPPPPAQAKPPHKKKQPKPKLKKSSPQMPPADFSLEDQVLDLQPLEFNTAPDFTIADPSRDTKAEAQPYTAAYLNAEYDKNPKPDYPSMARSRGWQGKVILRVQISAVGKVEAVAVEQSSGHDLLDESAVTAVRDWLFVPAMQANQPIASSVLVPIIFSLQDAYIVG